MKSVYCKLTASAVVCVVDIDTAELADEAKAGVTNTDIPKYLPIEPFFTSSSFVSGVNLPSCTSAKRLKAESGDTEKERGNSGKGKEKQRIYRDVKAVSCFICYSKCRTDTGVSKCETMSI